MMKKVGSLMFVVVLMLSLCTPIAAFAEDLAAQTVLFVATDGNNETGTGSIDAPFASLEKARDTIRAIKRESGLPDGGITVYIRGGIYNLSQKFTLGTSDSGEEGKEITYRAYQDEEVRITGGGVLDNSKFKAVTDKTILDRLPKTSQKKVLVANLPEMGVTEFGEISKGKFKVDGTGWYVYDESAQAPELFFNNKAMTLARYPNEDYTAAGTIQDEGDNLRMWQPDKANDPNYVKPEDRHDPPIGGTFFYEDEEPSRWSQADDIWMRGFWGVDWFDEILKVKAIDPSKKTITTEQPSKYGFKTGARFYYYNLLEEIDVPGEWYLDRSTGNLYLYPPEDIKSAEVLISTMEDDLVLLNGASYITLRGLTLEAGRKNGVVIQNGSNNLVYDSTIRLVAEKGVTVSGENNGVMSCEIYDCGKGGVALTGGDRKSLKPGQNFAMYNTIHDVDRIQKAYSPAISMNGVGHTAAYNECYNADHELIEFLGNDMVIEGNYLHDALRQTEDAGVIYTGRNMTTRGNIIRGNYFKNCKSQIAGVNPFMLKAVYLDDNFCSATIEGNVFDDFMNGVFINGGRDNTVKNNIFLNSTSAAVLVTDWGMTSSNLKEKGLADAMDDLDPSNLPYGLADVPYNGKAYSKYPHLAEIATDAAMTPKYNVVENNAFYNVADGAKFHQYGATGSSLGDLEEWNSMKNNVTLKAMPDFEDYATGDVRLKDGANVFSEVAGFEPVMTAGYGPIGKQVDETLAGAVVLKVGKSEALKDNTPTFVDPENLSIKPLIIDSRTLVPVRFIAESFGAKIDWNGDTATATITLDGKTIAMTLGSNVMNVDGQEVVLDVPAQSISGRTVIPLRAMVEAVGKQVFWDGRGLIVISDQAESLEHAQPNLIDEMIRQIG